MAYKQGTDRQRLYFPQRSYDYDSHDANKNFNGLTESEWKERIREEWTAKNLKAKSVVLIFHDKDIDTDNGALKPLHVHAVVYFKDAIEQSAAIKRLGCSCDRNCTEVKNSVGTYKYLLHINEEDIKAGKHIYDEERLEISTDGTKFDYHKEISKIEQEKREEKDRKKLQKKVVDDILEGVYPDKKIFMDAVYSGSPEFEKIRKLIGSSVASYKAVEHAWEQMAVYRIHKEQKKSKKPAISNIGLSVTAFLTNLNEET